MPASPDSVDLLRSSDLTLPTADIAIGYQQVLFHVERGWRHIRSIIDLLPVHGRSTSPLSRSNLRQTSGQYEPTGW